MSKTVEFGAKLALDFYGPELLMSSKDFPLPDNLILFGKRRRIIF